MPPLAPQGVNATPGIRSATLTWSASTGATGYTVTSVPAGGTPTVSGTSATVSGLSNAGTYTFDVYATSACGPSQAGVSNQITLPDVPTAPTQLAVTLEFGAATVAFGPPTSDGNSPITGYTVSAVGGGASFGKTATASPVTLTGLLDGTSYTFSVYATNAVGNGPPATTTGAPPCVTLGLPGRPSLVSQSGQAWINPYPVDLDGDGKLDLVLPAVSGVAFYRGHGDGTFDYPVTSPPVYRDAFATYGDFNGDGVPDVIAVDQSYTPTVYLGSKTGTFTAVQPSIGALSSAAIDGAVADLNHDGHADVVFATSNGTYTVLLGAGDGTFPQRADVVASTALYTAGLADMNGDAKVDLVLGESDAAGSYYVAVLLGAGDGTFGAAAKFASGGTQQIRLVDVNLDTKLDVVASIGGTGFSVLLGNGDGTLQAQTVVFTVGANQSIAVADVNGDGKPDAIVGGGSATTGAACIPPYNDCPADQIDVHLGDGTGHFGSPQPVAFGMLSREGLAIGDFDGDGKPDIAAANTDTSFGVLHGNGDGTFVRPTEYALPFETGWDMDVMNVDGPSGGKAIVVLGFTNNNTAAPYTNELVTYRVNANGSLQAPITSTFGPAGVMMWRRFASGDLNGDGKPDVLASEGQASPSAIAVLLNNGSGGFTAGSTYATSTTPTDLSLCDVNGDSKLDAVVDVGTSISIFPGKGDGTFGLAYSVLQNGFTSTNAACADVNADGKPDIVIGEGNNVGLVVALGNGNFTFQAAMTTPASIQTEARALFADVNGDGHLDVAFDQALGVQVFLGDGTGAFQAFGSTYGAYAVLQSGGGQQWFAARTAALVDMDLDGKLDLVFSNVSETIVFFGTGDFGTGDGPFAHGVAYPRGGLAVGQPITVASDFDGDGRPDVASLQSAGSGDGNNVLTLGFNRALTGCY